MERNQYKKMYLKNIKKYKPNVDVEELNSVFDRVYGAVFLDIDKTIIENEEIDIEVVKILGDLINKGIDVCFVTGRGRTSTRNLLVEICLKISTLTPNFNKENIKKIHCITNNGTSYLYSKATDIQEILAEEESLVDENAKKKYFNEKELIRDKLASFISEIDDVNKSKEEIIASSLSYSGEISLRFAFDHSEMLNQLTSLVKVKSYVDSNFDGRNYKILKGLYKDKFIIELSLTDKSEAVNTLTQKLGIKKTDTLRIGDQGDIFGNDYTFLDVPQGFSVDKYDEHAEGILPVIGYDQKLCKGLEATKLILNTFKFYPPICLENTIKSNYKVDLANSEFLCEARKNIIKPKYNKLIKDSFFNFEEKSFDLDIFDDISGALKISDFDFVRLKNEKPDHLLFSLFDKKNRKGQLKYSIEDDRSRLLRGPLNYYFGLCFRENKGVFDKALADKLNDNYISFLDDAILEMRKYGKNYSNYQHLDRITLLGIMDNIRNTLHIFLNAIIQSKVGDENVIIHLKKSELLKYYQIIMKNTEFMYKTLFKGNLYNFFNEYISFLEIKVKNEFISDYKKEYSNFGSNFNYSKAYRVWRETDNFLENIIAIKETLVSISQENKIMVYGMRYGAIELPILFEYISNSSDDVFDIEPFLISSKNNYFVNHSDSNREKFSKFKIISDVNVYENNNFHLIVEDNILTGRTLQVTINNFLDNDIYVNGLSIVRYPTLNRLEHMYITEGHGCPNVNLFFNKVYGLVSPAPYSRFNKVYYKRSPNHLYKDELGIFNINREKILRYLYKNGLFGKNSEVEYLAKEAHNEYIRNW